MNYPTECACVFAYPVECCPLCAETAYERLCWSVPRSRIFTTLEILQVPGL